MTACTDRVAGALVRNARQSGSSFVLLPSCHVRTLLQYGTKQEIAEFVRAQRITSETIALDFSVSPTTRESILRVGGDTGERELVLKEWSKQKYLPTYATISARGERLLESNMWNTFML